MLYRWPLPLAILGLLAVPASAADQNVVATAGAEFRPAAVTVDVGDRVTWDNNGGFHNVRFDDGSFEQPASPSAGWRVGRSFDTPGTYRYYCEAHGGPGGAGMSGSVTVRDSAGELPEPPESTPPGFAFATKRRQPLRRVVRGIALKARCTGGCTARFAVSQRGRRVGGGRVSLPAGEAQRTRLGLSRRGRKRLRRQERPFRLVVRARAANSDGRESRKRAIRVQP